MIIHDVVQGTEEWFAVRAGIPTASEIDKIITPKTMKLSAQADGYANKIVAERILQRPIITFTGNYYTERGKELEPDAIKLYEMQNDCDCEHVGFVTNDNRSMGCSPDSIVNKVRGLELKCPEANTHVGYLCEGTLPDEYKCQVLSSLFVTGFESWDFMSYYPDLPPFIITVEPDKIFNERLAEALEQFDKLVQQKLKIVTGG